MTEKELCESLINDIVELSGKSKDMFVGMTHEELVAHRNKLTEKH